MTCISVVELLLFAVNAGHLYSHGTMHHNSFSSPPVTSIPSIVRQFLCWEILTMSGSDTMHSCLTNHVQRRLR